MLICWYVKKNPVKSCFSFRDNCKGSKKRIYIILKVRLIWWAGINSGINPNSKQLSNTLFTHSPNNYTTIFLNTIWSLNLGILSRWSWLFGHNCIYLTLKTCPQTLRSKDTDGGFHGRFDPLKASCEKSCRQNLLHLQQKSGTKMTKMFFKKNTTTHTHSQQFKYLGPNLLICLSIVQLKFWISLN